MSKRKSIKNIAFSIAQSFISRNTDIDGYWAPALLYDLVVDNTDNKQFSLDLISGFSCPQYKYSGYLADKFYQMISKQLISNDLTKENITEAKLNLYFNVEAEKQHMNVYRHAGEPYICSVELMDELEKTYKVKTYSWCSRYSSYGGSRSTRRLKASD